MKRQDELFIDKVNTALLKDGKCVEDLLKVRTDEEGKHKETLYKAFTRYYKDQEDKVFVVGGVSFTYKEMLHYMELTDRPARSRHLPLPITVGLDDIQTALRSGGYPSWTELSFVEKQDALWEMGFAVKYVDDDLDIAKYYIDRKMYRGMDNKARSGLVVVGTERTDKEWLRSGFASSDALTYTKDVELAKDLRLIAGM